MQLDYSKYGDGLVPAIIQDASTNVILMLGFMNEEALEKTKTTSLVTFFSRSKNRLWVKGETSKNYLHVVSIHSDCDHDAILIKANPAGPVCHTGADTCFNETNKPESFLPILEKIISDRKNSISEKSYTSGLFQKGINKIAQKVGEEAVELVIESKDNNDELFINEAADLLFHYLILLQAKGFDLKKVEDILEARHSSKREQ
ncbi:MAG: bifunctional phosphoribosyl-AMP cyclohydrolase/phosphoribosyl-ATP diphosphatase HisIE [Ginsengibacter sp.]